MRKLEKQLIYTAKVHLHRAKANVLSRWLLMKFNVLLTLIGAKDQKIFSLSRSLWFYINGP